MHAADIVSDGGQTLSNYNRMARAKGSDEFLPMLTRDPGVDA